MPGSPHGYVIFLLADGFDELSVVVSLTHLRQAGLAVHLIGLRAKRVRGASGLIVVPDTSLDRFLAAPASILALVLPGGAGHLTRLRMDPRVVTLLQLGIKENATLVGLADYVIKPFLESVEADPKIVRIIEPEVGLHSEAFAYMLAQELIGITES